MTLTHENDHIVTGTIHVARAKITYKSHSINNTTHTTTQLTHKNDHVVTSAIHVAGAKITGVRSLATVGVIVRCEK